MHGTREKPGRPGESHHAVMNAIRFFVAGVELVIPSPELWTFGWQNQGPCQSVSSRYGTHWGSTLEPGIRGRWRYTYEKWLQSGRRRRCADIQRLPGCPSRPDSEWPSTSCARPHEVEPQCYRPHTQTSNVVLGHAHCRAVVLRFIDGHF